MKKYINFTFLGTIALFVISIIPAHASAATIYLEASRNTISVGDTAIITVKINAEGAILNTVDGQVAIKSTGGAAVVQEFSLAHSALGLWPRTPSLSTSTTGQLIAFVGGVPGGFSIEGATLFNIIVQATKPVTVTIDPQNMSVYLNDGKGTTVPAQLKGITLTVAPAQNGTQTVNDWSGIVSTDTTPPEPFIVVLGQDPSLFSGKKFAFFSAVDNQSGISYYDVSENGGAPVRSGSTYVLQDQNGNTTLTVTAYDKAGNKTVAQYPTASTNIWNSINWTAIIITLVILIIIYFIYRKVWPRKVSNQKNVPPVA